MKNVNFQSNVNRLDLIGFVQRVFIEVSGVTCCFSVILDGCRVAYTNNEYVIMILYNFDCYCLLGKDEYIDFALNFVSLRELYTLGRSFDLFYK